MKLALPAGGRRALPVAEEGDTAAANPAPPLAVRTAPLIEPVRAKAAFARSTLAEAAFARSGTIAA